MQTKSVFIIEILKWKTDYLCHKYLRFMNKTNLDEQF